MPQVTHGPLFTWDLTCDLPLLLGYNRFEKRHKNMSVHLSPCFRDVQIGDFVTVGECRPLSKTVRFNMLKVTKAAGTKKQFQKF
ncbi:30S ribosomal protein S11, chloroplastic [Saguinus oedipus]|uniref:Small ribosomal subunit protein uS17 n=1 Tax=Saguinus oedipus TaxID=9490 RepID=A0ABQ9V7W6_SAGOE|nr:30S ribosomal protein S11, chloroplastic [Saguinus oedipus]